MQNFNSLQSFAASLAHAGSRYRANVKKSLKAVGKAVSQDAQKSIGTAQAAIGPFSAWEPLAASTIEKKSRKGWGLAGNAASPLYATGVFQSSIKYEIDGSNSVTIGTNEKKIVFTELGTSKMPPRPVFGPAALRTVPQYVGTFAAAGASAIVDRSFNVNAFTERGAHFTDEVK